MAKVKIDVPFDAPIPITHDESFSIYKYSSYTRGYHAYRYVWIPLIGDDSLFCEHEKDNEHDKWAIAVVLDDCLEKKVVGHVPLYWSELAFKFLQFPNHSIRVTVTGKRVNRGAGMGLEIPVDYYFYGDKRVIDWFKKSIDKLDQTIDKKIGRCLK